jgi:Pin2-interacting protein X1
LNFSCIVTNLHQQLGGEDKPADPELESWWHDAFDSALKKISKKKKRKRSRDEDEEPSKPPTFDELFAATGGARLGMRARANQSGKLQRTADLNGKPSGGNASGDGVSAAVAEVCEKVQNDSSSESKREKKEAKKNKKDKKNKKKKQSKS